MKVIPKIPDTWIRGIINSSIIGALVGALATYGLSEKIIDFDSSN